MPDAVTDAVRPETQLRGWRALPPPLVLALCMSVITSIADALDQGRDIPTSYLPPSPAIHFGLMVAEQLLTLYGLALLRRRHHGTTRKGLRVLALALGFELALSVGWQLLSPRGNVSTWIPLMEVGWTIGPLVFAVGLAVALWPTRKAAAITALVLALALHGLRAGLPGVLMTTFPGHAMQVIFGVFAVTWLLHTAVFAWVMVQIAGDAPVPVAAHAARGLRHGHRALQLFALAMMGTLILGIAPDGSRGAAELLGSIYAIDLWLGAIALAWLGVSLVRAAAAPGSEAGSYLLGIAGAMLLVCGAGLLYTAQLEVGSWVRDDHWDVAAVFGVGPVLVVAAVGGVVLAAAIARFAGRTGFDSLRLVATGTAVGCGVLAIPAWLRIDNLDEVAPHTVVLAAGFALAACQLLGYLCKTAARSLSHTSDAVPVARVVSSPD